MKKFTFYFTTEWEVDISNIGELEEVLTKMEEFGMARVIDVYVKSTVIPKK